MKHGGRHRVIITGATGFIGRNLAERLRADGMDVLATGRNERVGRALQATGVAFRGADITNEPALSEAFRPADVVIHCAALPGDWGRYEDFHRTNVLGTRNVMSACDSHRVEQVIFMSSPSVYFNGRDRLDIREDEPLPARQLTHYGKTKMLAERELAAWSEGGRKVITFRPRAVFGPHDATIIPRILSMADKKRFPLVAGGRALVDITAVDNLVHAVELALRAGDCAWNETYNITNDDPITIREWFATMLEVFDRPFRPKVVPEPLAKSVAGMMEVASRLPFGPKRPTMTRFSVGYMAKSMTLDIEKAKRILGYEPIVTSREAFERYALWRASDR